MSIIEKLPFIGVYRANIREKLRINLIHQVMTAVLNEKFKFEVYFFLRLIHDSNFNKFKSEFENISQTMPNLQDLFDKEQYTEIEDYLVSVSQNWISLSDYMYKQVPQLLARPISSSKSAQQIFAENSAKILLTRLVNKDYVPAGFNYWFDSV